MMSTTMPWWSKQPSRIYADYAAATPVRQEVLEAMMPYFSNVFANPSAIHQEGVSARRAVETARTEIARTLRVKPEAITFTGSGTESNNLALLGRVEALYASGVLYTNIELITSETEHPSVIEVVRRLEKKGCVVHFAPVDEQGLVIRDAFKKLLNEHTKVVSFAYANSETGVVQDINWIGRTIHAYNNDTGADIVFHTDASQAPLWIPCALDALSVDMMTLDAGKCQGPKGIGVLVNRSKAVLRAVLCGGGQEDGRRAGTENVASIVGTAVALKLAQAEYLQRSTEIQLSRDALLQALLTIDDVVVNGSLEKRLANNINISIPGVDTEYAVVVLDAAGVACSTKSACSGASGAGSYVVYAMTNDEQRSGSTIRFSLGSPLQQEAIAHIVQTLRVCVDRNKQVAS